VNELDLRVVLKVEFYKRDELTTDLICCDVQTTDGTMRYHEEMPQWGVLLDQLRTLNGFRHDWFSIVSQPPFLESRVTAYEKSIA